jgi:hypothetical protein
VAEELQVRLPMVYASLLAGRIDLAKARALVEALMPLNLTQARAVADRLLSDAERSLTVGQLRQRLHYRVIQADPALAAGRTRHSVTQRRVYRQLDHDGTATLAGVRLPTDRAAAGPTASNALPERHVIRHMVWHDVRKGGPDRA